MTISTPTVTPTATPILGARPDTDNISTMYNLVTAYVARSSYRAKGLSRVFYTENWILMRLFPDKIIQKTNK